MYKKTIVPSGTGAPTMLMHKPLPVWQPQVGKRVMIFGAENIHAEKFLGKCGVIIKKRGLGIFKIKLDDGQCINLKSTLLKGLS